ncbi:SDR family oxidoreductase [Lutimonas zeaxanthinifaciens]|uniref:SDR family oxidoreductase n=1 Tax=Lutimonas zeaxanthinifaciens TaxID=3060215 RepID=UPI00265D1683|nr:SDR family oxidoreductase [Lutimonas sp. YSD2104]WKK67353.1 SDR family oxidoreductase [Lutimonas sp. YSD2104]
MKNSIPVNLEGKVILVTGGMGLIGKEISYSFLQQGAKVIFADLNLDSRDKYTDELEKNEIPKNNYLFLLLDITSESSCSDVIKSAVSKFGKLDVLINNAAIDAKFDKEGSSKINQSRFENYPIDLLRRSVEVNLTGTVIMTQVACKQMLKQGYGNIINVASTYSMVAPNQNLYDFGEGIQNFKPVDYIASKSFIPNFTRYIATFYANENIRCNAIVPHGIENNHPIDFKKNFGAMSPMGRMCEREELNGPFSFLASDASSYMTGSVLTVDGGWTAW